MRSPVRLLLEAGPGIALIVVANSLAYVAFIRTIDIGEISYVTPIGKIIPVFVLPIEILLFAPHAALNWSGDVRGSYRSSWGRVRSSLSANTPPPSRSRSCRRASPRRSSTSRRSSRFCSVGYCSPRRRSRFGSWRLR